MTIRDAVVCDRCLELAEYEYAHTNGRWTFPGRWDNRVAVADRLRLVPPPNLSAIGWCPRCAVTRRNTGSGFGGLVAFVAFVLGWEQIAADGWQWIAVSLVWAVLCAAVIGRLVAAGSRRTADWWYRRTAVDRIRRYQARYMYEEWPVIDESTVRVDDRTPRIQGRLIPPPGK